MFKKLRVKNFRSIRDSGDLILSKLNIIVGPNNSGKSSLLYAILLLKQTLEDKNPRSVIVTTGPHVDMGSYIDIIRGHNQEEKLGFEFELEDEVIPRLKFDRFGEYGESIVKPFASYRFTVSFKSSTNKIEVESFELGKKKIKPWYLGVRQEKRWSLEGIPVELDSHIRVEFKHFLPYLGPKGDEPKDRNIAMDVLNLSFASRIQIEALGDIFDNILYVGPIRERIPRYGILGTMPYSELGPSGQNLMRVLSEVGKRGRSKKSVIQELDYWLDKKFDILKNIKISNIDPGKTVKAIIADDTHGEQKINLAAMGSGVSQIVPVIVQTILTPERGCLIVEQPEIHLHPAAQADLGDLFVQYAKTKKQMIIETHSEHLLLRIRRRIAEGKISADLVKVFFVKKWGTETRVRTLQLEKNGHFLSWPKGFFEEGYKEAMAMVEAQPK